MYTTEFIRASFKLLNAIPVETKTMGVNKKLLAHGYVAPHGISSEVEQVLIAEAITLNKTFYGAWRDVLNKTREDIAMDQLYHYFTTAINDIFKTNTVIIPNEKFGLTKQMTIPLNVIQGLTGNEIKNKARDMIYKKVALKESTINDIFTIISPSDVDVERVQNRDSRIYIYIKHNIVPKDGINILRCAVYDLTGDLTVIKNKELYEKIIKSKGDVVKWLKGNEKPLASVFNRFKPIFMSFKEHTEAKPYINKISKLSKHHHKPLERQTYEPSSGYEVVRHLKFIIQNKQPKVYQVRNGKMWCTRDRTEDITKYTNALKILLPDAFIQSPNTRLALPTSEKNFVDAFPMGTQFTDHSLIVGINWSNQDGRRVDLDLSAVSMKGKIGWNNDFFNNEKDVVFSGDVVDAPNGANEYLLFKNVSYPHAVLVNRYTNHVDDVAMNIIVATGDTLSQEMIADENIIATAATVCSEKQKTLGVVYPTKEGPRFVLIDKCLGSKISVSSWTSDSQIMIESFMNNYIYMDQYATPQTIEETTGQLDLTNKVISKNTMLTIFK